MPKPNVSAAAALLRLEIMDRRNILYDVPAKDDEYTRQLRSGLRILRKYGKINRKEAKGFDRVESCVG